MILAGSPRSRPSTQAAANAPLVDRLREQYRGQSRDDVLALYTAALREAAGVSVNQATIEATLSRFP